MIVDVAEVVLQLHADGRHAAAVQLAGRLRAAGRRHARASSAGASARRAPRCWPRVVWPAKMRSSMLSISLLQTIEHREVAIDDGIHQRVEDVGRAVPQQLGLLFAAPAHVGESLPRAAPHRDHVVAADEDQRLRPICSSSSSSSTCAARRTSPSRTPRSSAAGGRAAHPRRPARGGRTPPAAPRARRAPDP